MYMQDSEKLMTFYADTGRMPTYEEMKKIFGVASKSTVAYKVNKLLEEGILEKNGSRLSLVETGSVIRLGTVQAGFPSPAEVAEMGLVSLDTMLIRKKVPTYMVEVQGESMKDAGILDGDLILVERGRKPVRGEIVLARVDNEYTLKYLDVERGKPVLVPANKKFRKIYPDPNELKIEAVLSAVVRKYYR
jgi:repressor LexA